MARPDTKQNERMLDLGNGMAIWKVNIHALREQDKNARVMSSYKFERMVENIKQDQRLESLPLCLLEENESGNQQFSIISGHHRTRAALQAGMTTVYALVLEEDIGKDEVISKQLAHNALQGFDDQQMLAELYHEIQGIDQKIATGILDEEIEFDLDGVSVDDIAVDLDFEVVNILFLPKQFDRFQKLIDMLDDEAHVYISDKEQFEDFKAMVTKVSKEEDIRNVSSIMSKVMDIVEEHYANKEESGDE